MGTELRAGLFDRGFDVIFKRNGYDRNKTVQQIRAFDVEQVVNAGGAALRRRNWPIPYAIFRLLRPMTFAPHPPLRACVRRRPARLGVRGVRQAEERELICIRPANHYRLLDRTRYRVSHFEGAALER